MGRLTSLIARGDRWAQSVWFGPADPRTYALLRIGFSIVMTMNWLDLWAHRHAIFSDRGLLDLRVHGRSLEAAPFEAALTCFGTPDQVDVIMALALVATCTLGLGLLTRPSAIVVFLWHLLFTHRAPEAMAGWDVLLRIASFYLMISPVGAAWSLDRWLARRPAAKSVPAYGLILMRIQLLVIYTQGVWLRLGDPYWANGEFLSYFLLSTYARFPHPVAAHFEGLLGIVGYSVLVIELIVPWLLWRRTTRRLGFLLGWGLHFSIALFALFTVFSLAMMTTYLAFLNRYDIERLIRWAKRFRMRFHQPDQKRRAI